MLSKRPKSSPVARAGSSVRDASECHLRSVTVSVGYCGTPVMRLQLVVPLLSVQYIDRWGVEAEKERLPYLWKGHLARG
jgi:hypothetical protein